MKGIAVYPKENTFQVYNLVSVTLLTKYGYCSCHSVHPVYALLFIHIYHIWFWHILRDPRYIKTPSTAHPACGNSWYHSHMFGGVGAPLQIQGLSTISVLKIALRQINSFLTLFQVDTTCHIDFLLRILHWLCSLPTKYIYLGWNLQQGGKFFCVPPTGPSVVLWIEEMAPLVTWEICKTLSCPPSKTATLCPLRSVPASP